MSSLSGRGESLSDSSGGRQAKPMRHVLAILVCTASLSCLPVDIALAQTGPEREITTENVDNEYLQHQDDVTAVTQVVLLERQARDRGWWDQMMSTYWPDSRVDLSWYHGDGAGFVYGSRKLYENGGRPVHRIYAPAVRLKGDRAHVEVSARSWSQHEVQGKRTNLYADMRLNYRLEKRHGEWRILAFNPIYEHTELVSDIPGEAIVIPKEELEGFRPTYATLAWALSQRGMKISQDELGADRPEELDAYYRSVRRWLERQ